VLAVLNQFQVSATFFMIGWEASATLMLSARWQPPVMASVATPGITST
jgi:hypothetical protein